MAKFVARQHRDRDAVKRTTVRAEFPREPLAIGLCAALLRTRRYDRELALRLIDTARRRAHSWHLRRTAVLMLEHVVLRLSAADLGELAVLSDYLGIEPRIDSEQAATRLLNRLARLNRVHRRIGGRTTDEAWRNFFHVAGADCKLTLARYVFGPDEVVREVRRRAAVTPGVRDASHAPSRWYGRETTRAVGALPAFEAAIAEALCGAADSYWVLPETSSELNMLVEYPLGAAALVIKPPGSDVEIEIKRTGVRGRLPLRIVFEREGERVPPSHRLQGGALGWLVRREAEAACVLSVVYRLVHGVDAPISMPLSLASVRAVPFEDQVVPLLPYLSDPTIFGSEFADMRTAMAQSIDAFRHDTGIGVSPLPGPIGLTLQFISQVTPLQIVLLGTSSFRLDRLVAYLSASGPEEYFTRGLNRPYTFEDARRLADDVLEEVLGVYDPPPDTTAAYAAYVDAALAVPANRTRADAIYRDLLRCTGECWGTLLGIGAYSDGESFVARNVGLRSYWNGDEWKVRIIFMDHDDLFIGGKTHQTFRPLRAMKGTFGDWAHIWGGLLGTIVRPGALGLLGQIYRVSPELAAEGANILRTATLAARAKAARAIASNPEVRRVFFPSFLANLKDWNDIAFAYAHGPRPPSWKKEIATTLHARGYDSTAVQEIIATLEEYPRIFDNIGWLYAPESRPA